MSYGCDFSFVVYVSDRDVWMCAAYDLAWALGTWAR